MRRLLAIGFTLLAPFAAMADERVSEFRLDNGLQIVVIEDPRAPVVVNMAWYRVGAADESAGETGLAHFLEHLMFKGTKSVAPGEFSKIVAAQGGSDNAFTSNDYTAYFQRVAADRLELMMQMEADRMSHLVLTGSDVDTERNVVIEERVTRTESNPDGLFNEQMNAAQYLNHPYGRPIIGWRHELQALSREAALKFYRQHYTPDNAILVVAGDVKPDQVRDLAQKYYGDIPAAEGIRERIRPQEPPQIAARRVQMEDARVGHPYLIRSYLAPARQADNQKDAAALSVLARLLGGSGPNSVLARDLQFKTKIAIQASAFYDALGYDGTTFGLVVVPLAGVTLAQAEAALDESLANFLQTGIAPEDFDRVKAQLKAAEIYALDSTMGVAQRYGAALTSGLTVRDVMTWPEAQQDVTPDEVMEAARKVFDLRHSVTGWLRKETTQ